MVDVSFKVKKKIEELIGIGEIDTAKKLLQEYYKIGKDDFEYYSYSGVIKLIENDFESAMYDFKTGLLYNDLDFDLNYNLAFAYENIGEYSKAHWHYKRCTNLRSMGKTEVELVNKINDLEKNNIIQYHNYNKKIVFFVKQGMDSFLGEVVDNISKEYNVLKIIVNDYREIDLGMNWADICWFEWCDDLMIYGSNLDVAKDKTIICRLHSYEAFTDYVYKVKWSVVDKVIFISESIRDYVIESVKEIDKRIASVIPNGINLDKWTYSKHKQGFNIAYVGYINYKKGPMLLLHAFKAIYDTDNRYMLYIAGKFQDDRDVLYFEQMIKEFGLENNIIFEGWQDNLDDWLEDKNYIICTSILESQNMSVMQAMAKGIKPLIHNFVGAKYIYNNDIIWNSIYEIIEMLNSEYDSESYREFINKGYSLDKQIFKIKELIISSKKSCNLLQMPLVTVGIANYNYGRFLKDCIDSILNQEYSNYEIIIVDDCSTDNSQKIIRDYVMSYTNIKSIVHKDNMGTAVFAFQEIINSAKGEYFILLSSDDYLANSTVICDLINNFILNPDVDYIYGNLNLVDEDRNINTIWKYSDYDGYMVIKHTFENFGSGLLPMTVGIHKTDYYRKNNKTWYHDSNNIVSSDVLNTLVNIRDGWNFKHVDITVINYRKHHNNTTLNFKERLKSIVSVTEFIINNFILGKNRLLLEDIQSQDDLLFYIINHYYEMLLYYYNNNWSPFGQTNNKNAVLHSEYFIPIIRMIDWYISKLIKPDSYKDKIADMVQELEQIKGEINDK